MNNLQAGYEGAQRASDHADRKEPLWSKTARLYLLEFLVKLRKTEGQHATFTTEDYRDYAFEHMLPDPPDNRAFGNVIRVEAKRGAIYATGHYRPSRNPQTHGRPVMVWALTP